MNDAPESPPLRVDARAFVVVALLALVAAAPSALNGFAYDDRWIIVTNPRVHSLAAWQDWIRTAYWPTREGSLYRPLTTAVFALEWVVAHGAPWVFHCLNIVLYVAGAVAFTWLASLLLPAAAALIVGALFAVDPVHVEAVGNVVGQSELSTGLAMLIATALYIRVRRTGAISTRATIAIGALYAVAIACKEHGFVLPAWLLVAEFTVLRDDRAPATRVRALAPTFVLLALIGVFALAIRANVLGTLGGDVAHPSVADLGMRQRLFVMLGVFPDIARLLVWPAKLYADYSPAHVAVFTTPDLSQLNGLGIAAAALALLVIAWRRSPVAAFGLLIAGVVWLPTSNLLFSSGVLLAERTLYLPSAGVLLAGGTVVAWMDRRMHQLDPRWRVAAGAVMALVLIGGAVRSISRQRVWRSSEEVFWTMVRDEPLSFKAHHAWGDVLFDRGDRVGGEREWRMAMRILPDYHQVYLDLAGKYLEARLCTPALSLYAKAVERGAQQPMTRVGVTACQLQLAQFTAARHTARLGMIDGNDPAWFRARLFSAESALVALDSLRK